MKYHQVYQYAYPVSGEQPKKEFLGNVQNKQCIFCKKGKSETSFKKDAHIIPAALGNRSLFNYDECDNCNEKIFSKYENDLLNYLQLERILIRGKPRKGSPKYRPINSKSFIASDPGTNQVTISVDENEHVFEVIEENTQENILLLKCNNLPPYSPVGICKTLAHMGFSVLTDDMRDRFSYLFDWLNSDLSILPLYLDIAFIPGGGMSHVILEIWESIPLETCNYPIFIRLTYGHKILTFYVPINKDVDTTPPVIDFVKNVPENIKIEGTRIKIKSEEKQQPDDCTFTIKYSSKENF